MEGTITLKLSDSALKRAAGLSAIVSRPIEDVLAETLEVALPNFAAEKMPPIHTLSDEEVLALAHVQMEQGQSTRLSALLDKQQAGLLMEDEHLELESLYHVYLRLWLRQSEALAEAVHRGIHPPLAS
jgi:hypothetical protein